MMVAGLIFLVMIIGLSLGLSFVVNDKNKTELVCNFWLLAYEIIFGIFGPMYYILKTPKLKLFVIQSYHTSKIKIFLGYIYFKIETAYDCFIFFIFCGLMTHWPKRKDINPDNPESNPARNLSPNNRVHPV